MTERKKDGKEIRIGVQPVGIIEIGNGEKKKRFLIDADHIDTLQAREIDQEESDAVLQQTGEKAKLTFPELDPEKVTFVQMDGHAVTAREYKRGVMKDSDTWFLLHGKNMITGGEQVDEIKEEKFSHLFLEPEQGDLMDFEELDPNNGNTDFLIISHDENDPERATIYFIADPADIVEDKIATTSPKTDLLQFVQKVHTMIVGTAVYKFTVLNIYLSKTH